MSDEFVLDTPVVRGFVTDVQAVIASASSPSDACDQIRPAVRVAPGRPGVAPPAVPGRRAGERDGRRHRPVAALPGGGRIAVAVLAGRAVRARRRRSTTTWHGAWSASTAAPRTRRSTPSAAGAWNWSTSRALEEGDLYTLLPPRDDIHRVRTTSDVTSVSIHLLTNDTGCVWRHAYDEHSGHARPFRSGYVNVECADDE